jgi:hypothetical protein
MSSIHTPRHFYCHNNQLSKLISIQRLSSLNQSPIFQRNPFQRTSTIVRAASDPPPPRRLIPYVLSIPRRVEAYFEAYPLRRFMWLGISFCLGVWAGNIVTLSFGALAINDAFAAIVTLIFYEIVSASYYNAKVKTLRLQFANLFKIGVVTACLADAVKLGG